MAVPDLAAIKTSMAAMVRMADRRVRDAAEQATVNLAGVENRMDRALPDLDSLRIRVDEWLRSSSVHLETLVRSSLVRAEGLGARLEGVSPIGTLSRGYAIVQTVDTGAVVSNSSDLSPGDITSVTLSRGSFESEVVGVTEP
jgi:exodeoxyribonuclease VII large subunit